jgi:23S rRNA-/tRNA-specific pseudouridylate synthase
VVGDSKYGGRKMSRLDRRWCARQFLHATRVEFNHPKTGERLVFESGLPEDLQEALNYLEQDHGN